MEVARRLEQRFALVAMWKRPASPSRNKHPALPRREKRRAQRHMLCPMTEMIGFRLVHHLFSEIDDGLSSTHLDLAAKSQAGDGEPNGQLQRDFLLGHTRSDLPPAQARRLAVDRESLSSFFFRRTPKVVETEVVSDDSRDHPPDSRRAVHRRVGFLTILVGLYRLPGRNPKRVHGRRPRTLSKSELGNVPAAGQRDQPNQIVLENKGLPTVPRQRPTGQTCLRSHQLALRWIEVFKPSWRRSLILETPCRRRAPAIRHLP